VAAPAANASGAIARTTIFIAGIQMAVAATCLLLLRENGYFSAQ
jgi:hypothetical protein